MKLGDYRCIDNNTLCIKLRYFTLTDEERFYHVLNFKKRFSYVSNVFKRFFTFFFNIFYIQCP